MVHAAPTPCSYAYIEYKKIIILKLVKSTEKYQ